MGTLSINNINIGRFGNKLLYLNNLFQISNYFELEPFWPSFEYDGIFNFSDIKKSPKKTTEEFSSDFFLNNKNHRFGDGDFGMGFCLGDLFFEYDNLSTHRLFSFKEQYIQKEGPNKKKVGIHFRGTDFKSWDPKSILPYRYYIESIKYVLHDLKNSNEEIEFFICTDDLSLESLAVTIEFLKQENQPFKIGLIGDMIHDFTTLSYCDIIISSPSTFSIAACFCGKENKIIINSKSWIDYRLANKDFFWSKVNQGGNRNYKNHKII